MVIFAERLAGYCGVSPRGLTLRTLMRMAYGVRLRLLHQRTAIWTSGDVFEVRRFLWTGCLPGDEQQEEGSKPASKEDPLVDMLAAQVRIDGRADWDSLKRTAEFLERGARGESDGRKE